MMPRVVRAATQVVVFQWPCGTAARRRSPRWQRPGVRALLVDVLNLKPARVAKFDGETELFGALPEFDSMAVATLLTEMEERLGILIEDEDVEAEDLMSFGRLVSLAERLSLT